MIYSSNTGIQLLSYLTRYRISRGIGYHVVLHLAPKMLYLALLFKKLSLSLFPMARYIGSRGVVYHVVLYLAPKMLHLALLFHIPGERRIYAFTHVSRDFTIVS